MMIVVNDETRQVRAGTLASVMAELGYDGEWLATAVNGEVVAARSRASVTIAEGDRIEILSPMQGG